MTACNQYTWATNDSTYTQSGTYSQYINGCYKETIELIINTEGSAAQEFVSLCSGSFYWPPTNQIYNQSGQYPYYTIGANSCPDTLTLNLTFNGGPDDDNDGLSNDCDNCPTVANSNQLDCNNNGIGDACEPIDTDCDGIADSVDNCPNHPNKFQTDLNNNGLGDACEDFPKMGFNTSNPLTEFHLSNGTIYIDNPEKGIILKNYQGHCFILKMDGLSLTATLIPCP
ncbi:MAG TPA: thrombospondin type 3 repeat-containing protein [Saprospiraceae bacterium]|nr:thrombospondin type 3 repeat-containing protein [Saprospiraceae bacterium]